MSSVSVSAADDGRALALRFLGPQSTSPRRVDIECVLDLDGLGNIVGVEILSLAAQTGVQPIVGRGALDDVEGVRVRYDSGSDALYVRIGAERVLDQVATDCSVSIDPSGRLLAITVHVPLDPS
jgi:uncharacterized protein YuzE